jgi:AraC-type DNA-binding domain-containing proteins
LFTKPRRMSGLCYKLVCQIHPIVPEKLILMICVHDNWARHNKPDEYPELHRHFYSDYSIFYGNAVKQAYEKHYDSPFTFKTTLHGYECYHFDNTMARVSPTQYLLLNRGQEYLCEVEFPEHVKSLSIFFGTRVLNDVLGTLKEKDEVLLDNIGLWNEQPIYFFEKLYQFSPYIASLQNNIVECIESRTANQLLLEELLCNLLHALLQQHNQEKYRFTNIKVRKASTQKECYKRLCYAIDYLHANYRSNDISLSTLADITRLSAAHLSKLFKESFKISPYQYLKHIRLTQAGHLLKNTSMAVNEIVPQIGYEDASAFIRNFKKRYHMTPEEYRHKN